MEKLLLSVEEAADRLSLGRTKTYELIASGQLRSVNIGRARRVPIDALEPLGASWVPPRHGADFDRKSLKNFFVCVFPGANSPRLPTTDRS